MNNKEQFVSGLLPYKKDPRDFNFEKVFGIATEIPDYYYPPLSIKDQQSTDMCVGFSATEVAEYLDNMELDPLWFFSKIKQIEGNYLTFGADFKTAGKATIQYGFLPQQFAPFSLIDKSRNYVANWNNYDKDLEAVAYPNRKKSYFFVGAGFQNMISAGYINKTPLVVGTNWDNEWWNAKNGIINGINYNSPLGNHALKFCGKKTINGNAYAIIQNSYGTNNGASGIYYFSKETIDKYFTMTPMVLVDIFPQEVKQLSWDYKIRLYNLAIKIAQKIIEKLNLLYANIKTNAGLGNN